MAYTYTAWSVVFGEQPTASKWNIIGSNMASVDERIGDNFSSGTDSPVWWEELGRHDLGGTGANLTVSSFGARKFLRVEIIGIAVGGNNAPVITFNSDTGSNYSLRQSDNGGSDSTATSQSGITPYGATGSFFFTQMNIINIATQEKICNIYTGHPGASGAGNVTGRREKCDKWSNTSSQITTINCAAGANNFASGSSMVVLGHD